MPTAIYNRVEMRDISVSDYNLLFAHLADQLRACCERASYPEGEAAKAACDALTDAWQPGFTAREWLDAAGTGLNVDTSDCVGA